MSDCQYTTKLSCSLVRTGANQNQATNKLREERAKDSEARSRTVPGARPRTGAFRLTGIALQTPIRPHDTAVSTAPTERDTTALLHRNEQELLLGKIHSRGMHTARDPFGRSSRQQGRASPMSWLGQQRQDVSLASQRPGRTDPICFYTV
jgi:hypothetical protein